MRMFRIPGRPILAMAGVVALMAAAPPRDAFWHTHLLKSDPAANDSLAKAPRAIHLWFSERVDLPVTTVKLTNAAGAPVILAPPMRPDTAQNASVNITIGPVLAAGSYTVHWSTAGKDGHPAKGTFDFVVKAH
ncbi:MAG: hypothetical protein JWM95_5580 [Gemmatimonadetes bacterium]|nr:hypothetical protein [Gemmatimonadota bacterium]